MCKNKEPRVLFVDIETLPLEVWCWGIHEQEIGLNQIKHDWSVVSWAARWKDDPKGKVMYGDNRNAKNIRNDKHILKGIWKLLDEADIVIGQNSMSFDIKKLNTRFIKHGMKPPSPFLQDDTLKMARRHFDFTSNKLGYLTEQLETEHKKTPSKKFPGMELWTECLKRNLNAFREMELYNKKDVLATESLYNKFTPYAKTKDFNLFTNDTTIRCNCGSPHFEKRGFSVTATGRFQRYQCRSCGKWTTSKINLLPIEKRKALRRG